MRVTIIPEDKFVSKDGAGYDNLDFTIDPAVHAVQWYDTWGEIEYKTSFNGTQIIKPQNQIITDISQFQSALDDWEIVNNEALEAARIEQERAENSVHSPADKALASEDVVVTPAG